MIFLVPEACHPPHALVAFVTRCVSSTAINLQHVFPKKESFCLENFGILVIFGDLKLHCYSFTDFFEHKTEDAIETKDTEPLLLFKPMISKVS